ncbi:glucokinase [Actibacterium sp. 188UL27-1]|uniref:glucokinase n=1 Tax=Actibacterium sp. 188UL27-1 TaxID=2786961 RepID=UPI00351C00D8
MNPTTPRSLIADIGGTNTRVALANGPVLQSDTIRRFRNADYGGLDVVLRDYFAEMGHQDYQGACVALAGPVHGGVGTLTNLDWTLDTDTIRQATGAQTAALLNDLQAQGYGAASVKSNDLRRVVDAHEGAQRSTDTGLVINVGTGFNAVPIYHDDNRASVPASECGHANLPIRTEADLRLCRFVETVHGFPAIEDVLSGRGLERVYHWLGSEADDPVQKDAATVMALGRAGSDARAVDALRIFTRIFGTVSGNLALVHLPFGGIYLVGGVARALGVSLHSLGYADAFRDKGRFAGMMHNFSIDIIEDDYAALSGSARYISARI